MTIEINEDQRQAILNGEPIRVSAPALGKEVVVLQAESYEQIREILEDEREQATFRAFARRQAAKLAKENPY